MEDEYSFYIFLFLPWKTGVFSRFNPFLLWRKPRAPLVSLFREAQGQGLFLLLRHRAAVAEGEGMLLAVFSYHESIF